MLSPTEFWAELEAEGEEKVREKLYGSIYRQDKRPLAEEWLRKKGEERQNALRMLEIAKERYKDYRHSGIAFSVTIISISSALMVWSYQLLSTGIVDPTLKWLLIIQSFVLTVAIGCALSGQYLNYLGYKHEARSLFGQSTQDRANHWFEKEDDAMKWVVWVFVLGIIMAATVFLSVTYDPPAHCG